MTTRHDDEDDFETAWTHYRAQRERPTKHVLGVDVEVPTDIPLLFEDKFRELADSKKVEHFAELLVMLFGAGTYDQWKANGITESQLRILTVWGISNANGRPTTFAKAVEIVTQAEADEAAGKLIPVPNRAARRASSKTAASAKGGRTSARISAASTGSRSRRSPT